MRRIPIAVHSGRWSITEAVSGILLRTPGGIEIHIAHVSAIDELAAALDAYQAIQRGRAARGEGERAWCCGCKSPLGVDNLSASIDDPTRCWPCAEFERRRQAAIAEREAARGQ